MRSCDRNLVHLRIPTLLIQRCSFSFFHPIQLSLPAPLRLISSMTVQSASVKTDARTLVQSLLVKASDFVFSVSQNECYDLTLLQKVANILYVVSLKEIPKELLEDRYQLCTSDVHIQASSDWASFGWFDGLELPDSSVRKISDESGGGGGGVTKRKPSRKP